MAELKDVVTITITVAVEDQARTATMKKRHAEAAVVVRGMMSIIVAELRLKRTTTMDILIVQVVASPTSKLIVRRNRRATAFMEPNP